MEQMKESYPKNTIFSHVLNNNWKQIYNNYLGVVPAAGEFLKRWYVNKNCCALCIWMVNWKIAKSIPIDKNQINKPFLSHLFPHKIVSNCFVEPHYDYHSLYPCFIIQFFFQGNSSCYTQPNDKLPLFASKYCLNCIHRPFICAWCCLQNIYFSFIYSKCYQGLFAFTIFLCKIVMSSRWVIFLKILIHCKNTSFIFKSALNFLFCCIHS